MVQIDASQLDSANDFDFVQLNIASPGSNADFYSVVSVGMNAALETTVDKMTVLK